MLTSVFAYVFVATVVAAVVTVPAGLATSARDVANLALSWTRVALKIVGNTAFSA